jgi:hypothetical protein
VSERGLVLLSVVAALGIGALGSYGLYGILVMGGRSALWLESHRWVYPVTFAAGCALLALSVALALWPLASLGGAAAILPTARYLWLNV